MSSVISKGFLLVDLMQRSLPRAVCRYTVVVLAQRPRSFLPVFSCSSTAHCFTSSRAHNLRYFGGYFESNSRYFVVARCHLSSSSSPPPKQYDLLKKESYFENRVKQLKIHQALANDNNQKWLPYPLHVPNSSTVAKLIAKYPGIEKVC